MQPNETSDNVSFKPVNAGLGFHPFSDGLPYAPISKADTTSYRGTGATAAGATKYQSPLHQKLYPPEIPKILSEPPISLVKNLEVPRFLKTRRVFSYLFDIFFNVSIGLLALWAFLFSPNPEVYMPDSVEFWGIISLFSTVLHLGLVLAQETAIRSTIGKRFFGLKLKGSSRAILIRSLLFLPSLLIIGLGLLIGVFRKDGKCWHDLATGVQVINLK